jgi:hypothetical protein
MRIFKQSLTAFLLFFTIILLAKLVNSFIIVDKIFIVDIKDLYLASLGVFFTVLIEFLNKVNRV